tara:strand:+ start:40102 stop:47853 length:7752 start_codon:yes stop_codon:yes gene_type:complete
MSLFSKLRHFTTKLILNWLNPEPDRSGQGTNVTKASSENHIPVVYGTREVGGTIVFMNTTNPDDGDDVKNDLLHLIVVWCEGGIDGVEDLWLNKISINDSKFDAKDGGRWAHAVHFPNGMGNYTYSYLKEAGWDAASKNHKLQGLACSYIRLEWSIADDAPFTGVPDLTAIIRGKKVKNLHTGAVEYSENPAYILHDYLTASIYGKELAASEIYLQSFKDAATVCDTLVPQYQGASETQKLFTCNQVIDTAQSILDNVELLGKSMRGIIPIINGQLHLIIEQDEPVTPEGLSERDFKSKIQYSSGGKNKRYNRVIVEYIDKEALYSEQDAIYPEKGSELEQQWLAADNGVLLEHRFKVSACTNYYEARQMARVIAMLSRESLNFTVTASPIALQYTVGDIVPITVKKLGWDEKPFRLIKSNLQDNGDYKLTFKEHQPYIYNWLSGVVRPPIPDSNLPNPRQVAAPTELTATALDDGHVKISWVSAYTYFDVQIYRNNTLIKRTVTPQPEYIITDLDAGSFEIDIRARSNMGYHSEFVTLSFDVLTPGEPIVSIDSATYNTLVLSARVLGAGLGTTFEWQFLGTNDNPRTEVNTHSGYNYTFTGLQPDTEYNFKVRTKNVAGVSPWVAVSASTTVADFAEYIADLEISQLSQEAQNLISDINQQVDRLRPETENNLPSLIAKNIDAITGLTEKVEVLDAENPNSIPFKIDQLVDIVDVINAENPNNLQSQLAQSTSKINDLERITQVLDASSSASLPALIKINQIAIEKQRLEQQNLGLSVLNVTSAYTNWRNEYERRTLDNERLIDAAAYVDPDTGTIVNRAYAYTDESFNSAQLLIEGAESKITLNAKQIAQSQNRITQAEATLKLQAGQITQRATFAEVESQIAGALAALQPAYSWQFNTSAEGFTGVDSHNAQGYIVASSQVATPAISYDATENPMFRIRVRKHVGATWRGDIKFNGGTTALHLPEPASDEWETLNIDATGTAGYAGTITSLEFDLGSCDIDFIEVGKRGANDLALADITARTTTLENDINARTGIMAQYATTAWVNALGFQTQSNVQALIDSFNTKYSISAVLQEFSDNNTILKANAAQTWIDGANATIREQVNSILNTENGVNDRIATAERSLDAIKGEISQSVSQISGLELNVKEQGLADIIHAYNQLQQDNDLAAQGYSLSVATEKLTAVTNDVESLATQQLELAGAFAQNQAYLTSLNQAFANERTARSSSERELRAEITREGQRSVAQANERLAATVGYCIDADGNLVDEADAMACIAAGHEWIDGPLVELINEYTATYVNKQGFQTAANVEQYINTLNAEYGVTATIQQINDEGVITAAKEAQQWINAADGTITDLITQYVNKPDGINTSISFAYDLIQANADEISATANAQQQLSARFDQAESDINTFNEALTNEQQARATMGSQLRVEFQSQDLAMLATANEFTRAVTGYCIDAEGNRVDEDDAIACEAAGHTWVDGPAVQRAVEISAAWVTLQGYQTQSNVQQSINSWDASYGVTATIQQINDDDVITAAKEARSWINAAEGTIEDVITQYVNKPDGINTSLSFAYDLIQANADELSAAATARQQLSTRLEGAEADIITTNEALTTEQQARATMGSQLRVEFQSQDLAMLATANEFTRAVTGYCIDAEGNRVDEDDAIACETAGHTWVDGPAVQRAVEISAAWVTLQGFQTQSNVQQQLDTFNSTYQVSATLEQFAGNNTLQKANNAQLFIDGAEEYIAQRITAYNAQEGSVNAKFSDVQQRLDAAEGSLSTSIVQIQGLSQAQQASDLNAVIAAYDALISENELAELDVKAALANEKLQAQTNEVESLAQQQLELAALFNDSKAIITSLNQAVSSQYQSSVIRDQRYQATFENVSARFSDVTTAIATIDEANTLRDQEFESFVADTIAQFDEVAETFASQDQAFSTLQQTLTAKINEDTEAAKNEAVSTAQQYTRTAVGYCVNAQGQITSESDAVQCVTDGGTWLAGPLAEYIENLQISDGESTASIKQIRQVFTKENGQLVARGGWTLDNNGRIVSIAGYNDGETGHIDIGADLLRFGVVVDGAFVPTSYIDNADPANPVQVIRGRLVLGDGHTVNSLEDIRAQDGEDGKTPTVTQNPDGSYTISNGTDSVTIRDGENAPIPTVTNNGNGTYTVTDGSGNSVIVRDGEDGYTPVKGTDYFDGNDGSFVSYIFKAAISKPSTPSGGSFDGATESFPSGWNDTPIYVSGQITWVSKTRYRIVNNTWTKTEWSSPVEYIIRGEKGESVKGDAGARGAGQYEVATSTGTWSDAIANAAVPNGTPVAGDIVHIYKSSDITVGTYKKHNGSVWVGYTLVVDGNALFPGSVDGGAFKAGTRIESPRIDLIGTNFMKIELASGFGPENLWYWYGPKFMKNGLPDLSMCTRANATEWKDTNGNLFTKGTFIAGSLESSVSTSQLVSNPNRELEFTSNGNTIHFAISYSHRRIYYGPRDGGPTSVYCPSTQQFQPVSGTVYLERWNGSSWVVISSRSFSGTYSCEDGYFEGEPGTPNSPYVAMSLSNKSWTYNHTPGSGYQKYRVRAAVNNFQSNSGVGQFLSLAASE